MDFVFFISPRLESLSPHRAPQFGMRKNPKKGREKQTL